MIDKLFTFEDKYGNLFHCKDGKLTLQLVSENRVRNIGNIVEIDGLTIFKKFEDEEHIYRKTNAWSVPVQIFEKVDGIWFFSNRFNYKILTKKAKENLQYLSFTKKGYEPKVYIPLKLWNIKSI
jgi:hypothetical protein